MNCKQGDLAIITRSHNGLAGMVVTCVKFIGEYRCWVGNDFWDTDLVDPRNGKTWLIPDAHLRPIRPQPDNA